jgi:hypothetical protein
MYFELSKIEGFMNSNLKIVLKKRKKEKVYYIVYNGLSLRKGGDFKNYLKFYELF